MDTPITRAEHEEFRRAMEAENQRLADEDRRQNRRIELVEENIRQIGALTTSVEKLAANMESMVKELEKQGKRLDVLESRDGEMWRKVTGHVITVIIGVVLGYIFTQIGIYNEGSKTKGGNSMSKKTETWLKAAGIRAVKTFAQSAVAMLPAAAAITAVDWGVVAGTAALAAVASLLTSLAGLPELDTER